MGRILAVDFGHVRIGLALSDPLNMFATPLENITGSKNPQKAAQTLAQAIQTICKERKIELDLVVIGLPLHLDGSESERSAEVRALEKSLQELISTKVVLFDERMTTLQAEKTMIAANISRKKRARTIDGVSSYNSPAIIFRLPIKKGAVSSPIYIHILSLDTVGGVESLYVHYLKEALARGDTVHYTCVSGKKPHPHFSSILSQGTHKPFLEQYVMGMRLPKWLRAVTNIRRGMIEDLVKPTSWVYWNRIEDKIPPGHAIYYEHGATWTVPPTKKRKEFLHHCKTFIANSKAAMLMLQKRWDITSPITVLPNPLRPDISLKQNSRNGILAQPLRLGFIGRLVPVKAPLVPLFVLRELLKLKIPATLSIAGVGPLKSTLQNLAKRLGVDSYVTFCGCVSDVSAWYDSIDMLIVPSIREPLGLVSLEAAARGVPVIAANVDGLPEVVSHEKTGLLIEPSIPLKKAKELVVDWSGLPDTVVSPHRKELVDPKIVDPHDCVLAIHKFMNNPSLYSSCSAQAIDLAKTRASFDSYHASLKSILENTRSVIE